MRGQQHLMLASTSFNERFSGTATGSNNRRGKEWRKGENPDKRSTRVPPISFALDRKCFFRGTVNPSRKTLLVHLYHHLATSFSYVAFSAKRKCKTSALRPTPCSNAVQHIVKQDSLGRWKPLVYFIMR